MPAYANLVQETSITTGLGAFALQGATPGNRTFVAGVTNGVTTTYLVTNGSGAYEIIGGAPVAGSPDTLTRLWTVESSNSNNPVSWTGVLTITQVLPAQSLIAMNPEGTRILGLPASIDALQDLTPAAARMVRYVDADTAELVEVTGYAVGLLGADDAAAARVVLDLVPGTDVQAHSAILDAVAAAAYAGDDSITTLGTITAGTWQATAIAVSKGGTGAADADGARTNLGVVIGTDVQAYSATLAAIAAETWTGAASITTLGTVATGTWSATAIAVAKGGTGATDASGARTNLGLVIGTDVLAYSASTGSNNLVRATSPTLVTPVLGVASATSIAFGGSALSAYEQSTSFTPTLGGVSVAGTHTYSIQVGRATRIGNVVSFVLRVVLSAKDGAMSGAIYVGGLPYTSANVANLRQAVAIGFVDNVDFTTNYTAIVGWIEVNSAVIRLSQVGDNQSALNLADTGITNVSGFMISGSYLV